MDRKKYLFRLSFLILIPVSLLLAGCGDSGIGAELAPVQHGALPGTGHPPDLTMPTALPVDVPQPWESLDAAGQVIPAAAGASARGTSAINGDSVFVTGGDRYRQGGDVTDLGVASRFASGTPGSSDVSFSVHRLALGGVAPGVVCVDANLALRDDGSRSSYWVGLGDYGSGTWDWHGPVSEASIRLQPPAGGDYLSGLGNLFVAVVACQGSRFDLVGVGANAVDPLDTTAPASPNGLNAVGVTGGIELVWYGVPAADLAGYIIYYRNEPFVDPGVNGVRSAIFLEGQTNYILPATGETFIRITAVDVSGNESTPSDIASAVPLSGQLPVVTVSTSAVEGQCGAVVTLTAVAPEITGAIFDIDTDGDGIFDLIGISPGSANVGTSSTGVVRPRVHARNGAGTMAALGSISTIISSNIRPVADGYASPAFGEAPHVVIFTGQGFDDDGTIVKYAWDYNGDGTYDWSSFTTPNPPAQMYSTAGTYNTKFRVTDDKGSIDIDTVTVTVYDPEDPPVNIPPVASLSANRVRVLITEHADNWVWFDAAASTDPEGGALNYEFDLLGDGMFVDYGATDFVQYDYEVSGVYLARLRVTDTAGASATDSLVISVYQFDGNSIVTTSNVGEYASLAVVDGNPAIAYYDSAGGDLYYIRANDSGGLSWGTPVLVDGLTSDAGQYCSLGLTGNWPAISYFDDTSNTLTFCKAANVEGTVWAAPTPVAAGMSTDVFSTMLDVGGRAAICYFNISTLDLMYTRSTTAGGTAWGAPVTVDTTAGRWNSMVMVNGRPAISYYGNTDLRYTIADDPLGAVWPPLSVTIDNSSVTGLYTSLEVVDGNPAISYMEDIVDNLMYVRATGVEGLTWGTPVEVVTTDSAGHYSSLAVIFGVPSIAYFQATGDSLYFVTALDATGTTWDAPLGVDYISTGNHSSLVELANGLPGIAYYQHYARDLVYANVRLD